MTSGKTWWTVRKVLLIWGITLGVAWCGGYSTKIHGLDGKKVQIETNSFTNVTPARGWVEVEMEMRNRMTQDAVWRLQFISEYGWQEQNNLTHQRAIEVPAQSVRTVRFEVPVYPAMGQRHYWYPGLNVRVIGPGSKGREQMVVPKMNSSHHGTAATSLAVSDGVRVTRPDGTWDWNTLSAEVPNQGIALDLMEIDLERFPLSQKGLTGIDLLLLTEEEWEELRPHHQTVRRWVAQGGHLILYGPQRSQPEPLGLGTIRTWELRSKDMVKTARKFTRIEVRNNMLIDDRSFDEKQWPLRKEVPDIDRPVAGMVLAVIGIAALLGPINLGVALRQRKTFQVLWTTPLLSVAISLLLGLVILFSDGLGGKGVRAQWTLLMPGERLAFTWQEQVSRTGLLLSTSFEVPEEWWMRPMSTHYSDDDDERAYSMQVDGTHSGDWFANRRVQAQVLQRSAISRSSVQVRQEEAGVPRILSTVEQPLTRLYYRDRIGVLWTVEELVPGHETVMRKTTPRDFERFQKEMRHRKQSLFPGNDALNQGGWFYAEARNPEGWAESLGSIRWEDKGQWMFGPVVEAAP